MMCKILKVNRSAYYHWINNGCIVNKVDERLNQLIKDIFYQYREVYGTRPHQKSISSRVWSDCIYKKDSQKYERSGSCCKDEA